MEDTRKFPCVTCYEEYTLDELSATHLCVRCIGRKMLQTAKRAGESHTKRAHERREKRKNKEE